MRSKKSANGKVIAVLLLDNHAVVREGLRLILKKTFPGCVVGEAKNAEETLDRVRTRHWDVLVLDLSLPGKSGLEVLRETKQLLPDLRVLVFSMHPESQFAAQALRAGADGYVSKDASREEFILAMKTILGGQKYISTQLAGTIACGLAEPSQRPPHELLSGREFEVMLAIAAGRAGTEIATDLSVSTKTISTYRRRLLQKMRMNSNADLTRYVLEHELLAVAALVAPIPWLLPWTKPLLDLV
jgi:two-component system, NarL family, invasion response regulator UvrY